MRHSGGLIERTEFVDGIKAATPVALGYLPYGTAFGMLAKAATLSLAKTFLMSALVYAGTAQLIAIGMLQAHQPLAAIVATTFFVNSRYLLMSTALFQPLKSWSNSKRGLIAYYLSDETFALLSSKSLGSELTFSFALGVNTLALIAWVFSSLFGFALFNFAPDLKALGFDYALVAVFIGLLFAMTRDRTMAWVALVAGVGSVFLRLSGIRHLSVLLAASLAATLALVVEAKWEKRK